MLTTLKPQTVAAWAALGDFSWEESAQPTASPDASNKPKNTASARETQKSSPVKGSLSMGSSSQLSSTSSTQSSSSSSATPSATVGIGQYVISSKRGTSLDTFKEFIEKLDRNKNELYEWDVIKQQMYLANIR